MATESSGCTEKSDDFSFLFGNSFGPFSDLSSPVESGWDIQGYFTYPIENKQHPHVILDKPKFIVGQGPNSHLCLGGGHKDVQTPVRAICSLKYDNTLGEHEATKLLFSGTNGSLRVNDKICHDFHQWIRTGDELIFSTTSQSEYRYIFRKFEDCSSMSKSHAPQEHITNPYHLYVLRCILDVLDISVCFEDFPYYLSESTKDALISSTYVHLEYFKFKKSNDAPILHARILLLDPTGSMVYQETLIKGLAKHCGTRLLILNSVDLFGETAARMWLFRAILIESKRGPLILFLKGLEKEKAITDVDLLQTYGPDFEMLVGNIVVIAAQTDDLDRLSILFPTKVTIQIPESEELRLKRNLDRDNERMNSQSNFDGICLVLDRLGMSANLKNLSIKGEALTSEGIEQVAIWAVSHSFMHFPGLVTISKESIEFAHELWKKVQKFSHKSLKDAISCNIYERSILGYVILSAEIGVCFDDIGALGEVKQILFESVILPLQRPELFGKGLLAKACKGILLFGPPGTGKTMLAKAIATEVGANFINIMMSSIAQKEFGQSEKYVQAIFTLAKKLAPTVIFFDEVDSMLTSRQYVGGGGGSSEAMRRIQTEVLMNWDGLLTNDCERVLVLGATNRPFDIDDAAIRRFSRRLMVSLPDERSRVKILRCILADEALALDFDFEEAAKFTHDYSGSDLKNLCVAAAHCRIRELLNNVKKGRSLGHTNDNLRPISMDDMKFASRQIRPSAPSECTTTKQLLDWHDAFGEGGSQETDTPSYII